MTKRRVEQILESQKGAITGGTNLQCRKSNMQPNLENKAVFTRFRLCSGGSWEGGCRGSAPAEIMPRHMLFHYKCEHKLTTYQPQFEQPGDDPVKHPSVVLLVDLVCDLLDDVFCRERSAVHLAEALCVL